MGAWSTRIFDDDGASDIRAEYKILLGYGIDPKEAYEKIREFFYKDYEGQDDEDVYWLSIALFQWQNGILMQEVKEKALYFIEQESYLERWKEGGERVYQKRKEILNTLKNKLLYEVNPTKKKFPKCPLYYRKKTKWKVGDLIAYRVIGKPYLQNSEQKELTEMANYLLGKYVLLRVVAITKKPVTFLYPELDYSSSANMMLYDWVGEAIPLLDDISQLEFRPIAVRCLNGVWEIASGIGFELLGNEVEKECCEITYLGNDEQFLDDKPELYKMNDGCPWEHPSTFNITLAETFLITKESKIRWHYRD